MTLADAYRQIEQRLERMNFPALFRGFHRFPFALYNDTEAYMNGAYMEKPATFLGNTSIVYNGAHTAIWDMKGNQYDPDVLTSKLAHEMLHAFQNAYGETRWADERVALVKYRYDAVNFTVRLEEADCMKRCLSEDTPEAFERLLALRRARYERFPYEYDYEARIEQIEGTAHFVELKALAQLDAAKAEQRWKELLDTLSNPAGYFPVRPVTYLSGAAFLACLRRYTDFDTDTFNDTPFPVAALKTAQPSMLVDEDVRVAACLEAWRDRMKDQVTRALEKGDSALEGLYRLIGWNVYDAYWDGQYAVISGFVGYIEGTKLPETDQELFAQMKILNGNFVLALDENLHISHIWRR